MNEQKNLFIAVLLAILIMMGFDWVMGTKKAPPKPAATQAQNSQTTTAKPAAAPQAPQPNAASPVAQSAAVEAPTPRVKIETPRLKGSIALKGGRVDDIVLLEHRETLKPDSKNIVLLSPTGSPNPYFAEFGWVSGGGSPLAKGTLPDGDTVWTADNQSLSPDKPVTLSWDNGQGLVFKRIFAVDKDFMFTVTQKVENKSGEALKLSPYGLISRTGKPQLAGMYILHEGPLGVFDGTLKEMNYEDLGKKGSEQVKSTGGWIGITDKYWLAAVAPDPNEQIVARFLHHRGEGGEKFQVDWLGVAQSVAPGAGVSSVSYLFAGVKQVALLDGYAENLGLKRFDLAIDFGWFYFLTKPFFYLLKFFSVGLGNFGLAILALTVLVKGALFPLANKSYIAMSKMKKLQPQVQALQQQFADDRQRMNQELMGLYKREKVNPMAGCLPIIVQIPVFFALYKVLFVTIEMRHAPFYGWIHDLSAIDPTTIFNLFGLIPWTPPEFLMIGIWPLVMGVTMWLQQKLNPAPTDPVQAKVFTVLPIVFTFLLASFPAGLVIYWAWSNILSILQQWVIMRKMGVKL
jgi:YidC/Oxa1 family membrane protein insertase